MNLLRVEMQHATFLENSLFRTTSRQLSLNIPKLLAGGGTQAQGRETSVITSLKLNLATTEIVNKVTEFHVTCNIEKKTIRHVFNSEMVTFFGSSFRDFLTNECNVVGFNMLQKKYLGRKERGTKSSMEEQSHGLVFSCYIVQI